MATLLWGLSLQLLVPGLVLAVAFAAGKLAARALGLRDFRVLRPLAPGTGWKSFGVRSASVVAAFTSSLLLGTVATKEVGRAVATTTVRVLDGSPAKRAGMKDGDRVVSIDGKPCASWEALRADIRSSAETRSIVVDRNGERVFVAVTPNEQHVIGVEAEYERRPVESLDAVKNGFALCFAPLRKLASKGESRELAGPVGIQKVVSREPSATRFGTMLYVSAIFAAYAWLAVLGFHLFDTVLHAIRRR